MALDMQLAHFIRTCSSVAALSVLIWECLINFDHEYAHIWHPPTGPAKRIYLFARYYGICWHIVDAVAMLGPLANLGTQPLICTLWHGSKLFSCVVLLVALEVVLSIRLYALYCKSRNIGVFLAAMLGTGVAVSLTSYVRSMRAIHFTNACVVQKTPYDYVYFCIFSLMRHALLWMLTIHKRNVGRCHCSNRAPIVHLMLRDGALIFGVVSVTLGSIIPSAFLVPVMAQTMFPWLTSLVSIFTCRVILNMQRLQIEITPSAPELTTNIEPTSTEDLQPTYGHDGSLPDRHGGGRHAYCQGLLGRRAWSGIQAVNKTATLAPNYAKLRNDLRQYKGDVGQGGFRSVLRPLIS
ncbi:hypothetical protein LshimejAT787_0705290 [Lyophyllum shimeji]|uniref:DUF6533 domain-containing protein n=1 Tax=Lyophyllum shimeji TaxID=47721 RepID=A0A9P3PR40_LYOSH|nr:hypothetical protein LshimejAT787_0705290 [Lyophyllum shimeji]